MPVEGPAEEKSTRSRRHSGEAMSDLFAQCSADPHRAGNSGTVVGAGGWDASHVRCAVWWLTSSDFRPMPRSGCNKCARPVEWLCRSSSLPRGVSNEVEFPSRRGPAESSAVWASSETESACAPRGFGVESSGEAEFAPRLVRPRKGRTVVLGRGLSVFVGFLDLERILDIQV